VRISDQITQAEIDAILVFATQHHLETEGPDSDKNANEIGLFHQPLQGGDQRTNSASCSGATKEGWTFGV
jgi:hypothetical protein